MYVCMHEVVQQLLRGTRSKLNEDEDRRERVREMNEDWMSLRGRERERERRV